MLLEAAAATLTALTPPTRNAPPRSVDEGQISTIEHGLIPAVVIAGRPVPTSTLTARMKATNTPAVSIAFIENGHVRWARAYGLAGIATERRATPETLFQAASISKPVTAVGAMRLVQEGKLNLDQDVNDRLKEWHVPQSKFTLDKPVTLRGLLSHTAGLTVHGFPGYAPGRPLPTLTQILNGSSPANSPPVISDARPGERWSYSGGGYVVAQLLMTEADGRPFPGLMQRLVLGPAGMTHSLYEQPLRSDLSSVAATGYFGDGKPLPNGHFNYPELGPAGLWTTPSDLAKFAIALQDAYNGASDRLLDKHTARLMLTRQVGDFGLGLNVGPADLGNTFEHGGSNQGFQSEMRVFLDGKRQGVIIMTNGDGGQVVIGELMRAIARTYGWKGPLPERRKVIDVSQAVLAKYEGTYEIKGLANILVSSSEDGHLYVVASALGPQKIELLAESPTRFFSLQTGVTLEFRGNDDGLVSAVEVGGPYGTHTAVRQR